MAVHVQNLDLNRRTEPSHTKNDVERQIIVKGHTIFTKPRRLSLYKFEAAKKHFEYIWSNWAFVVRLRLVGSSPQHLANGLYSKFTGNPNVFNHLIRANHQIPVSQTNIKKRTLQHHVLPI